MTDLLPDSLTIQQPLPLAFVRGEAVAVVLYDPLRDLIGMVEQFRVGALDEPNGPWCYEVVAGMLEEGESPEDVARRELLEEANVTPYAMEYICNYLSSPGGTTERIHLLLGELIAPVHTGVFGLAEEHEDIKVHLLSRTEAMQLLAAGKIDNAATVIALQWLELHRLKICAAWE